MLAQKGGCMIETNPWKTIWTEPRATIASVVSQNPNRHLWWLSSIYGFSSLLNTFQSILLGATVSLPGIFLLAIVFAPLWGYICFSVWSWVVSFTGKWLKGVGTFQQVRAAYAWSVVPLLANIPLWFVLAAVFGQQLFTNFSDSTVVTNGQVALLFAILLVRIGATVWSIVIYINALAQVQQFTILRAIGNILLAGLIFAVAAYLILILFFGVMGQSAPAAINPFNLLETL